jgi:oligoribonuclease
VYVSIDIETLGLDPDKCDIIEFGAVIDDLKSPIKDLPFFHCYLSKDNYQGEPYAMSMHHEKLKRISKKESGYFYLPPDQLDYSFSSWLISQNFPYKKNYCPETSEEIKSVTINVAGKNFSSFDLRFLRRLPNWGKSVNIKSRVFDPAILFFDPQTMDSLPDLKKCLEISKINKEVSHTAVDDAIDVINCLRFKWNI